MVVIDDKRRFTAPEKGRGAKGRKEMNQVEGGRAAVQDVPRIDATMMVDWLRCREFWRWRWRWREPDDPAGLVPALQSNPLEMGKAFGLGVQRFYEGVSIGAAVAEVEQTWASLLLEKPDEGERDLALLTRLLNLYYASYSPTDGFRTRSEMELTRRYEAVGGQPAFVLIGRLDGIGEIDGVPHLAETKTLKRPETYRGRRWTTADWLLRHERSIQIQTYFTLLRGQEERSLADISTLRYDLAFKDTPLDADSLRRPEPAAFSECELMEFGHNVYRIAADVARSFADHWDDPQPMNTERCHDFGRRCEFYPLCFDPEPGAKVWSGFKPRQEHLQGRRLA